MANLNTAKDILDDALFRAYEPTDGTSQYDAEALVYLNRAYRAIWTGGSEFAPALNENFWWLKKSASIIMHPPITSGTVDVELARATVVFSTPPSPDVTGRFLVVEGHTDVFKIASHTAGSANATLDSIYTGETDSAGTYRLMQLDFDLASDLFRLISPMSATGCSTPVDLVLPRAFNAHFPLGCIGAGTPQAFTITDEDSVRFNTYGLSENTYIRVDYDYLHVPSELTDSDTSVPLIPIQYRQILSDITAMLILEQKNDTRATGLVELIVNALTAMANENRSRVSKAGNLGQIYPRGRPSRCGDSFPSFACSGSSAVSGIAIAGCAIAGTG